MQPKIIYAKLQQDANKNKDKKIKQKLEKNN